MIDREKVIKGLECCGTEPASDCHGGCPYDGDGRCIAFLCQEALALLKEQEAVKPVPPEDEFSLYRCGKCHHQLFRCVDKYCSRCGRLVKWE